MNFSLKAGIHVRFFSRAGNAMGQISLRYQSESSGDTGNDFLGRVATVT